MWFTCAPDGDAAQVNICTGRMTSFLHCGRRRIALKYTRHLLVLVVIAALALGAWGALAHGDEAAAELPAITIEKSADGYTLPADIPEGVVAVTFNNQSETVASPNLARLNPDVTLDAFMEALTQQGPFGALPLVSLM